MRIISEIAMNGRGGARPSQAKDGKLGRDHLRVVRISRVLHLNEQNISEMLLHGFRGNLDDPALVEIGAKES